MFSMIEFSDFSILAWRVRGAKSATAKRNIRDVLVRNKPSVVIITEPRIPLASVDQFWNSTGYKCIGCVDPSGFAGGIWVFSNDGAAKFTVIDSFQQAISFTVSKNTSSWNFSAIYASPVPGIRTRLWNHLRGFLHNSQSPWVLLGDFNEILYPEDNFGGQFRPNSAGNFMKNLEDCNMQDLGFKGPRFTWHKYANGIRKISKRLDWGFCSLDWRIKFPEASVTMLPRAYSDHHPILLRCSGYLPSPNSRSFRFEAAWTTHPDFDEVVSMAWSKGNKDVSNCLFNMREDALEFNREKFGNIFRRKRTILARLEGIHRILQSRDSVALMNLERDLQKDFNRILEQEEILWFQKSRELSIKFGDKNTRYFHAQTVVRRKRNKVEGLFLRDGQWATDPSLLQEEALEYFQDLFCYNDTRTQDNIILERHPSVSPVAAEDLSRGVSKEEVWNALKYINTFKAPGPDGFQPIFFKKYWHIVGDDIHKLVSDAFRKGYFNPSLADTLIVLIPKVDAPKKITEFRPISQCNVVYKILTKVSVNRIRPLLNDLISPLQSSFIPGRGTRDNILIAQEIIHYISHTRSQQGALAFKIDLEKAYDRVNWEFLANTLNDFGFPERIIKLIMFCVSCPTFTILWNGGKLPSFAPRRGLRQGDPLSPYLFVMCMEKLSLLIQKKVDQRQWQPLSCSRGGPKVSHLLFADDVLLFTKANISQARVVSSTLKEFCRVSGLKILLNRRFLLQLM